MWPVEEGLQKLLPDTFDVRYFDYRDASDQWAARPAIASCLADYVNEVSANNLRDHGDGKVYLAAHSMGGLAIRFASDQASVPNPIPATVIGGVVTFDTPHQGSPFGGTMLATVAQFGLGAFKGSLPGENSDAAKCLARHNTQLALPDSCATPPYLPSGTRVTQIAAANTVRRTIFGHTLYDLTLNSDGVVAVDSSHGYLNSGPAGATTPEGAIGLPNVGCTTTSDQTMKLLKAAVSRGNLAGGIIKAEMVALGQLWYDDAVQDQINSGKVGPELAVMLATALLVYPCGHSAMLGHADALRAAADALSTDIEANQASPSTGLAPPVVKDVDSDHQYVAAFCRGFAAMKAKYDTDSSPAPTGMTNSAKVTSVLSAMGALTTDLKAFEAALNAAPAPGFDGASEIAGRISAAFTSIFASIDDARASVEALDTSSAEFENKATGQLLGVYFALLQLAVALIDKGLASQSGITPDEIAIQSSGYLGMMAQVLEIPDCGFLAAGSEDEIRRLIELAKIRALAGENTDYRLRSYDPNAPMTADAGVLTFFRTPSGNIGCTLNPDGPDVICHLREHSYPVDTTLQPGECGWVDQKNPDYVVLGPAGALAGACIGDVAVPPKMNTLSYGQSITNGVLICSSAETGVTCKNSATGAGFTVNKNSFAPSGG